MKPSQDVILSIREVNRLSIEDFRKRYVDENLSDRLRNCWNVRFETSSSLDSDDLAQCFQLVQKTSASSYKASSRGWHPDHKKLEMRDVDMKYLLVRARPSSATISHRECALSENETKMPIIGFLSFMVTVEDEIPVVYCYEVHVDESMRNQGLGWELMRTMEAVGRAAHQKKAMLTVFTANQQAIGFYRALGYEIYDEEPMPPKRRLRGRSVMQPRPSYVIMALDLF